MNKIKIGTGIFLGVCLFMVSALLYLGYRNNSSNYEVVESRLIKVETKQHPTEFWRKERTYTWRIKAKNLYSNNDTIIEKNYNVAYHPKVGQKIHF